MPRIIRLHPTLVTPRIQFYFADRSTSRHTSSITPRIDFIQRNPLPADEFTQHQQSDDSDSELPPSSPMSLASDFDEEMNTGPSGDEELDTESQQTYQGYNGNNDLSVADTLIPKPQGEPGRPRSGGYNLESCLIGWTPDLYAGVRASDFPHVCFWKFTVVDV